MRFNQAESCALRSAGVRRTHGGGQKEPKTEDYRKFMMGEARYSALTRSFPDRAEGLFERSEVESTKRYAHLKRLQDLYAPEA